MDINNFCVEYESEHPLWNEFIEWLNVKHNRSYTNHRGNDYYGVKEGYAHSSYNNFGELVSLEEWFHYKDDNFTINSATGISCEDFCIKYNPDHLDWQLFMNWIKGLVIYYDVDTLICEPFDYYGIQNNEIYRNEKPWKEFMSLDRWKEKYISTGEIIQNKLTSFCIQRPYNYAIDPTWLELLEWLKNYIDVTSKLKYDNQLFVGLINAKAHFSNESWTERISTGKWKALINESSNESLDLNKSEEKLDVAIGKEMSESLNDFFSLKEEVVDIKENHYIVSMVFQKSNGTYRLVSGKVNAVSEDEALGKAMKLGSKIGLLVGSTVGEAHKYDTFESAVEQTNI